MFTTGSQSSSIRQGILLLNNPRPALRLNKSPVHFHTAAPALKVGLKEAKSACERRLGEGPLFLNPVVVGRRPPGVSKKSPSRHTLSSPHSIIQGRRSCVGEPSDHMYPGARCIAHFDVCVGWGAMQRDTSRFRVNGMQGDVMPRLCTPVTSAALQRDTPL